MKFVFDLDGTICFKGRPVSEAILGALESLIEQGHEVVFASARPIRDLLPVLHERFHHYAMIGGNGSMVAAQGKMIATMSFDTASLSSILQLIHTYNVTFLIDSDWNYAYTGPASHSILRNLDPQQRAQNISLDQLEPIVKILMLTADNMAEVERQLKQLDVVVHSHGNEGTLDISPCGIDKWSGLQQLGVEEGSYIAFGNDANDISMFQHALHSVMIGENTQLAPFSSEQILLCEHTERLIVDKLMQLGKDVPSKSLL